MNHQGIHYKCTKKVPGGKSYFVCAMPNLYCKGTAIKLEDGTIVLKKPHTHQVNNDNFNVIETKKFFRDLLIGRAKSETTALKVIYDEESIRNPEAAMIYTWPTAESSMRQARRQAVPPLPGTLRELGEYLDRNINRYQCNNQPFYQEWIVDGDGYYNIMFACHDLISEVVHQGGTELHADGTFKVVPSMPHCRQLFMIHLILQNHSIPVCFVLMESKTETSYKKVLERFKIKFPNVRPTSIMIDFEIGLYNAFQTVYPEAQISSCWFHFIQSLQKNIKKLGYTNHVQHNIAAKLCVQMTAVLALLPPELIEQGFQEIKTFAQANGVILPRFFTYFTSFWLIRKGPECFSVYGQPRRTNNNIESFHSSLKQTFQIMHPNLWKMLEHLNNISHKQHIIVGQLLRGLQVTRSIKSKYILNSVRIKNATDQLNIGVINIKEFLIKCSHCTYQYLDRELNWAGDENEDSEDEIQEPLNVPAQVQIVVVDNIAEDNIEPEINIVEVNGNNDFNILEDMEMNIWQNFDNSDDEYEIPYVEVPQNVQELHPQPQDEENICVVCRVAPRTHALVPCGHRVLCVDCLTQLEAQRCPLCNQYFNLALRIW